LNFTPFRMGETHDDYTHWSQDSKDKRLHCTPIC
jgi:hypothetical protein